MKGELSVSSVPEQGSCFRVLLPLHIISPSPIADNLKPQVEASHFDGQSVLLVEDNEVNQLIARHLLEKLNLTVTCCRNGAEAVAAVQNARFACILMDLQMPVMDGLEATRQIRALPRPLAQIPIIAMTAHASEEHRLESMENGMDEHLTKPIVVRQLQLTLARFLGVNNKSSDGDDTPQNTEPGLVSPVMDMHRALARLGGNRLLFAELLGTFVREHEGDCHRIVTALVAGDHHSAMVRLHSLAGSAGNIGAAALANTAVALQHRLAGGRLPDLEELRSELDQSWQMLMLQIQAPDGTLSVPLSDGVGHCDPDEASASPFLDPCELLLGCEKIMNWLHQDLVQVDETLSSLLLCPVPSLYLERLSQLQQLLNQFCIEDAEALLQQLIDDLREAIAYE
jgi:CheY-like chemotaxis protein